MREVVAGLEPCAPKSADSFDREVPVEATLQAARALRHRYGITRIADTTRLDRIGIPTIGAIVPNSPDRLGVYNGKGLTRDVALAGAFMEAIERQICARFEDIESYAAPLREVDAAIDLRSLGWLGELEGASSQSVPCVRGVNLMDGCGIDVPIGVVRCPRAGDRSFAHTSTNGLASGNTVTEAVYHALMELVERHLWSRVHLLAHVWPRILRSANGIGIEGADDPVASDVVDADEHPVLYDAVARIRAAGLQFRLLAYVEAEGPYAMMACIADPSANELFYHLGFGCSWSPVHAAIRAITEAVQVRLTDVQGAREDIKRACDVPVRALEHGRRAEGLPSAGRWYYDGPAGAVRFAELDDRSSRDLRTDLDRLVKHLRDWGETCVAYVDLTPRDLPLRVARLVTPHLERTLVDGTISARMQTFMRNPLASVR